MFDTTMSRGGDIVEKKKAFSFNERALLENFSIQTTKPELIKYFESNPEEEVVLLFIDITNFSKTIQNKDAKFITSYLNQYYNILLPIIYKYNGQVEKIMGDGVICLFGKPFTSLSLKGWLASYAENCAQETIIAFKNTNQSVKIALHIGKITYYKVPGDYYEEYTMLGAPLTELYRLESIAEDNAINFYKFSDYDKLNPKTGYNIFSDIDANEVRLFAKPVNLPGVNYTQIHYLKFF